MFVCVSTECLPDMPLAAAMERLAELEFTAVELDVRDDGGHLRPADVAALHERIVTFFQRDMIDVDLFVPYAKQRLAHTIHQACSVLNEVHDEEGTRLFIRAPQGTVDELRQAIAEYGSAQSALPPAGDARA